MENEINLRLKVEDVGFLVLALGMATGVASKSGDKKLIDSLFYVNCKIIGQV